MNFNIVALNMPVKPAEQMFLCVDCTVAYFTSAGHGEQTYYRGLYWSSSKTSQESLDSRQRAHNTVDTKYVILCSVSFIYEHSLRKYVLSHSVATTLHHICRFIKPTVHCEREVLGTIYNVLFSFRSP